MGEVCTFPERRTAPATQQPQPATVTILPTGWFGPPQTKAQQKRKARAVEAPCDTEA